MIYSCSVDSLHRRKFHSKTEVSTEDNPAYGVSLGLARETKTHNNSFEHDDDGVYEII